jgi:hypothetical protein
MKLTDLEQRVIVPITDQTRGGIQYEVEISLEELLKGTLEDFEPAVVEAMPVEWLRKQMALCHENSAMYQTVNTLLHLWQKEQGTHPGRTDKG